jgi:hypothetical protein
MADVKRILPYVVSGIRSVVLKLDGAPVQASQAVQQVAVDDARDAARYRYLRNPDPSFDDFPPSDGACWVVQYYQPKGIIPEMRSAGFGIKLDTTIDAAMSPTAKESK